MFNIDLPYKSGYFSFLSKNKNNKLSLPMKHHSCTKARLKKLVHNLLHYSPFRGLGG